MVLISGCAARDNIAPQMKQPTPDNEGITYEYMTEELYAERNGNNIYGVMYIPQNAGERMPAVIFSHGFGGNYQVGTQYAEALAAEGYVVYCFDFCGGSPGSLSDGSTLEMSIFTEQADLEAVIAMLQGLDYVDSDNLFLMGTSQGGAVSAITAAAHKEEIKGAILLYPAFCLVDQTKERFDRVEDIPDTYFSLWMTVGRAYAENLLDYDIYEAISTYEEDVLILHGDADSIVPLSCSERAVEVYSSARLEVFPGAGHGFHGEDAQRAIGFMLEYLDSHKDSMTLPVHLSEEEETTREYEIGDLGYWNAGPDLTIFYDDIMEDRENEKTDNNSFGCLHAAAFGSLRQQ